MAVQDPERSPSAPAASGAERSPTLPLPLSLGFGVGTVGVSCLLNPVTAYFPAMLATVFGLSPAVAGLLLTGSKLYDICADIVIGAASDRSRSRWGRRRPFMLAGALLGAAAFALIFNPWVSEGPGVLVFMAIALMLYSTGYSLFNIPYLAMPAEMTDHPAQRVSLISYRTFFLSVGQMISVPLAAAIIDHFGRGAAGYGAMGLILAAFILLTTLTTVFSTGKAKRTERTETQHKISLRRHAAMVIENRPFVLLMSAKVFVLAGMAATASTQLFFFLNVLGSGFGGVVKLSVALNIAMALSMPVWVKVIGRFGKRDSYIATLVANALLTLTWLVPGLNDGTTAIVVRGALYGVLSAGIMLAGTSMLPDTMEHDHRRTGQRREGVFASLYAIVEKFSFATVPAIVGVYIAASGYVSTKNGMIVAQPHSAITALYVSVAILPAALHLVAAAILAFYRLDESSLTAASRADGEAR